MKSLYITLLVFLSASFLNPVFCQTEISYDLTCISTPFHLDFPFTSHRTYCDNGIMNIDTLDPCKDFYIENGIPMYSLFYPTYNDNGNMIAVEFGDIFIEEESLFNQPESKIIEMTKARIGINFPEGEEVSSVAFDIEDISNEGILFRAGSFGKPVLYTSVSDIVEVNDSVTISMVGNRVFVEGNFEAVQIGGIHIKIGNIIFNETPEIALSTAAIKSDDLHVFPNPVQDFLNITCENKAIKTINIFDTQGKIILGITQSKFSHHVNMDNWNSGIYLAEIELEDGKRYFQKIIKR